MIIWILKKCKCKLKSSCTFNSDEMLECPTFRQSIDFLNYNYEINENDIIKIFKTINKKKKKENDPVLQNQFLELQKQNRNFNKKN